MQVNPLWRGTQSPLTHGSPKQGVGNTLHLSPAKPGGQRQLKVSASPSWHVPPLKQGLGSHRTEKWKQRITFFKFSSLKHHTRNVIQTHEQYKEKTLVIVNMCVPINPDFGTPVNLMQSNQKSWKQFTSITVESNQIELLYLARWEIGFYIHFTCIHFNQIAVNPMTCIQRSIELNYYCTSSPRSNRCFSSKLHPFQSNCDESNDLHSNDQSDQIASSPRSNRSYPIKLQIPVKFLQTALNSKSDCISIVSSCFNIHMHACNRRYIL